MGQKSQKWGPLVTRAPWSFELLELSTLNLQPSISCRFSYPGTNSLRDFYSSPGSVLRMKWESLSWVSVKSPETCGAVKGGEMGSFRTFRT